MIIFSKSELLGLGLVVLAVGMALGIFLSCIGRWLVCLLLRRRRSM